MECPSRPPVLHTQRDRASVAGGVQTGVVAGLVLHCAADEGLGISEGPGVFQRVRRAVNYA
eukprot:724210-Pyramimonas_sp.AAC.1